MIADTKLVVREDAGRGEEHARPGVNDLFPHKVCINLDRRADRWRRVSRRFAEHGIARVERFPALDAAALDIPPGWPEQPGAYGCLMSHLAVVEEARGRGLPRVLIFEDDAVFAPDFNAKFSQYVRQLPADWDMLLFGGIHIAPPTPVADNVVKITHTYSTFAYALRHTIYDAFIELNRRALTVVDDNNRALQKRFNCYSFMPHLAWVEEDFSDVRGQTLSHWWIKESLVLWGDEMDRVLDSTALIINYDGGTADSERNLRFVVNYYTEQLPGVSLVVVEHADAPTLDAAQLPPRCRHLFLPRAGGATDRQSAFDAGYRAIGADKDFFVFTDGDLLIERDDLRANLLQARRHDFVSAFRATCDLTERETLKVLGREINWDAATEVRLVPRGEDVCSPACIFTKRGLEIVGGWGATDGGERLSERVRNRLRVYESPNRARRLFQS